MENQVSKDATLSPGAAAPSSKPVPAPSSPAPPAEVGLPRGAAVVAIATSTAAEVQRATTAIIRGFHRAPAAPPAG